ncbi:MAG: hypothetical protein JXB34_02440 [Bacteroidales bacterium]|nr:hypothetical protein [Bacteroidales bacterium]
MKTLLFIGAVFILTSCSSTVKFPVSQLVPAADISAKVQKQGGTNYLVVITANNLASSERLSPPRKYYIIWVVSESGATRNVGHFRQKNAIQTEYKASFPYKPAEVFITAEDEEALCQPTGIEISRVKF